MHHYDQDKCLVMMFKLSYGMLDYVVSVWFAHVFKNMLRILKKKLVKNILFNSIMLEIAILGKLLKLAFTKLNLDTFNKMISLI